MSTDARALRAALEAAQAELKALRDEVKAYADEPKKRERAELRLEQTRIQLANIQHREKDLLSALFEAKRFPPSPTSLDLELKSLRQEADVQRGETGRRVVLAVSILVVVGLVVVALKGGQDVDRGIIFGTLLVVVLLGWLMRKVGGGRLGDE